VNLFPYIFAAYMAVGGSWLFILSLRRHGILAEIDADLDQSLATHEQRVVPVFATQKDVAGPEALPSTA